ncbi:hypothetical protein VTK56DRAFT_4472 [Thermocarpiscus australiensis]
MNSPGNPDSASPAVGKSSYPPGNPDSASPAVGRSSSISVGARPVRRNTISLSEITPVHRQATSQSSPESLSGEQRQRRRRSSTFSAYSLSDVSRDLRDEIIDPGPRFERKGASWWSWLPLAFAVLPPVGGLFFRNGSLIVTDIILLVLAAIFLHWSVTAPWKWYESAQQIRMGEEAILEVALEGDSDGEEGAGGDGGTAPSETARAERLRLAEAARSKLRTHEVMALATCFLAPAASTYLMYWVRNILSRPSEGLVSDFNLTIFFLAAEVSPLSHSIKLLLSHTLHLQRVVHSDPYKQVRVTPAQWQEMNSRLEQLETRLLSHEAASSGARNGSESAQQAKQMHANLVQDVRKAIQPEIDALNRAVRRYERKARLLALQTDSRLRDLGTRVDDAISLSAVVAGKHAGHWSVLAWLLDSVVYCLALPLQLVLSLVLRFLRWVSWLFGRQWGSHQGSPAKPGRGPQGARVASTRVPRRQ